MIRKRTTETIGADDSASAQSVLIASEGRAFNDEVIALALRLVAPGGHIRVVSIARLWGTSFGLPNPGLRPSKAEMKVQEDNVATAIEKLKKAGAEADGHIITTRDPRKSIHKEAKRQQSDVIIMGADPQRAWIVRGMMWSQEPYRVRRRAPAPVYLLCSGHN
jgi:nucleotide-binding universal stress UspA family protein